MGAGVNLTLISRVRLASGDESLESRSTGTAKGLNPAHDNVGTFKIDPLLFRIGFGKRL